MKTKLTIDDCFKYPNAKIRRYEKRKAVNEYKNIMELLNLQFCKNGFQTVDINKHLSKCKLVLKDVSKLYKEVFYFGERIFYVRESDKLRADNFDIDGMQESERAVMSEEKENIIFGK